MEGIIIKNISNDYLVRSERGEFLCKARGRFRNLKLVPLVGDNVIFDEKKKYLLEIKKRKNCLIRPSVANVDQAIIVCSVKNPDLDSVLLDKLLTIISFHGIFPIICFTKIDLLSSEEKEKFEVFQSYYKKVGYFVVTNEKKENFYDLFQNKITVLAGQSGAGKSSLLNLMDSSLNLKTDQISYALNRGKHTTRHTELYDIFGGYVVDTPGFSQVDFHDMTKVDIRNHMNEMYDYLPECRYRDCMHIKEEGCRVKQLLLEKKILNSRYQNYKYFIENKR